MLGTVAIQLSGHSVAAIQDIRIRMAWSPDPSNPMYEDDAEPLEVVETTEGMILLYAPPEQDTGPIDGQVLGVLVEINSFL